MKHARIISGNDVLNGTTHHPFGPGSVVLAGGCFDVVHYGHIHYLKEAKASGDILVVALENDEFIKKRKKRAPFHTQMQRAQILSELRSVDVVILLPTMHTDKDYEQLVMKIKPHVIAITKGDTHATNKNDYAKRVGGTCIVVNDIVEGLSSSIITTYGRIVHD